MVFILWVFALVMIIVTISMIFTFRRKTNILFILDTLSKQDQRWEKEHIYQLCKNELDKRNMELIDNELLFSSFSIKQLYYEKEEATLKILVGLRYKKALEGPKNAAGEKTYIRELTEQWILTKVTDDWNISSIHHAEDVPDNSKVRVVTDLEGFHIGIFSAIGFAVKHAFSYKPWKTSGRNPSAHLEIFMQHINHNQSMSIKSTVWKTILLIGILVASASWVFYQYYENGVTHYYWGFGAAIVAFVLAIFTVKRPKMAPLIAPVYACLEGLAIGTISIYYEMEFQGIVATAAAIAVITLFVMLIIYLVLKPSQNFIFGIVSMTFGLLVFYVVNLMLTLLGSSMTLMDMPLHIGIPLSFIFVIIAGLNLIVDFDVIRRGAEMKAAKYMEWYAAFSLMITLIWLYLELLRLLSKARSQRS